jgi:Mor family transcriptional regulator
MMPSKNLLTLEQKKQIYKDYKSGVKMDYLAREYNVSHNVISTSILLMKTKETALKKKINRRR